MLKFKIEDQEEDKRPAESAKEAALPFNHSQIPISTVKSQHITSLSTHTQMKPIIFGVISPNKYP